ncbi:hypothetical protein RLIN73S_03268 [Rhodanobacter lindaniclasticus]
MALHAEVRAGAFDLCTTLGQRRKQTLRRIELTHDRRPTAARYTGLLAADAVAIGAEPFHVIEIHGGDHGHVGINDVHRVEAATQAHFEHRHVDAGAGEQVDRRQRAEFEIGQRNLRARRLDAFERFDQRGIGNRHAIDADAFVVGQQVRRSEGADPPARRLQHRLQQRHGGTLAIGAGHGDHARRRPWRAHALPHLAHALESQLDAVHVDALLYASHSARFLAMLATLRG